MGGCRARIFHVNDVYVLDNLPALKTAVAVESGDLPRSNVITTLAGDFLGPSLLSSLDHGVSMVDMMNRVPVDAVCFGNHESDVPYLSLKRRIEEFNGVWLNSNMPGWGKDPDANEPECPHHHVFNLEGGRSLVMLGLNVGGGENASLYRDGALGGHAAGIVPVLDAVDDAVAIAKADCPDADAIVPLTHQDMPDDLALARKGHFPLILGGHDHGEFDESVDGCVVLKAGEDAKNVVIVDLYWPEDAPRGTPPQITVAKKRLAPPKQKKGEPPVEWTPTYVPCPEASAAAKRWLEPAKELEVATLTKIISDPPLSSVGVRSGVSSMATLLATAMRDVVGADAAFMNSGGVRAKRVYTDGTITYADLNAECPFPSSNVVIKVVGAAMSEALSSSRTNWPEQDADSFQCDEGIEVDAGHRIVTVKGEPFDPERMYSLLVDAYMVTVNPVLKKYAAENPHLIPPDDAGSPALPILVKHFCDKAWRALSDGDGDGDVTREEVDAFFDDADVDHDGSLDETEVLSMLSTRLPHAASRVVAHQMLAIADRNQDGKVSKEELVDIMLTRM